MSSVIREVLAGLGSLSFFPFLNLFSVCLAVRPHISFRRRWFRLQHQPALLLKLAELVLHELCLWPWPELCLSYCFGKLFKKLLDSVQKYVINNIDVASLCCGVTFISIQNVVVQLQSVTALLCVGHLNRTWLSSLARLGWKIPHSILTGVTGWKLWLFFFIQIKEAFSSYDIAF